MNNEIRGREKGIPQKALDDEVAQDTDNQWHGILKYCRSHGIDADAVHEDTENRRSATDSQ